MGESLDVHGLEGLGATKMPGRCRYCSDRPRAARSSSWAPHARHCGRRPRHGHPVVARQPLGNVAAAVTLTLNDRSRDIVDRAARRFRGSTRTACQPVGAGLARFAEAVEHMPPLTRGEDLSTHARVYATGCELTVGIAAQGHAHALGVRVGHDHD
jgi:hypothetical protein